MPASWARSEAATVRALIVLCDAIDSFQPFAGNAFSFSAAPLFSSEE
jgi:hypothetical protein